MHHKTFPSHHPLSNLFFLTVWSVSISNPYPETVPGNPYSICQATFACGWIEGLSYPFWSGARPDYCGHPNFKLENCQEAASGPTIAIGSLKYRVMAIDPASKTLKIARSDLWESLCPAGFVNTTLEPSSLFAYTGSDNTGAALLYGCPPPPIPFEIPFRFSCEPQRAAFLAVDELVAAKLAAICQVKVVVPVLKAAVLRGAAGGLVAGVLREGFEVTWRVDEERRCGDCVGSGGVCGYNRTVGRACCFCPDGLGSERKCRVGSFVSAAAAESPSLTVACTKQRSKRDWGLKAAIGITAACVGMGLMCFVFFLYQRRKRKQRALPTLLSRSLSSDPSSKRDAEKGGIYLGVHIFSYSELEEATNNFDSAQELGDGGFGTVYRGKLRDGRCVAVKRLYENNYRRLEQFMNEVEILTRLRHQNLVSLYGCTSRHSRELLLVYEYVPNGTVADHLHGDRAKAGSLTWPIRMSIATETASALSYLHASDIIHRDVKTTNILLDNNFGVKVADFGLSRLFPTDVTHVSTAPQGTPGYVDPEYHQCYQLTDKSDVYSFGVVLIELISSKPAVDITRHRHEINLSNMAIIKIQNQTLHELVDTSLGFETDCKVRKMIAAVAELAFQCLQNEKEMRPSMEEVLEALKHIQSEVYNVEKGGEGEILADDAVPLKGKALTLSPDTVTANWISRSTTPNASS